MQEEIVYIQNMESPRDVMLVSQALEGLGLQVKEIEVGAAAFFNISSIPLSEIDLALERLGYILLDPRDHEFGEKVRINVSDYLDGVLQGGEMQALTAFLEERFNLKFNRINHQYRMLTGISIDDFYKRLRVERVKALITNANLSLLEIVERLSFGNLKNLRRSFVEVTGQPIEYYSNKGLGLDQTAAA